MYYPCEECQFELHSADGRKLLKWNAVPTIFVVPNPPRLIEPQRNAPKARNMSRNDSNNEHFQNEDNVIKLEII